MILGTKDSQPPSSTASLVYNLPQTIMRNALSSVANKIKKHETKSFLAQKSLTL